MPRSRNVRITRQAISPRLAMRTFRKGMVFFSAMVSRRWLLLDFCSGPFGQLVARLQPDGRNGDGKIHQDLRECLALRVMAQRRYSATAQALVEQEVESVEPRPFEPLDITFHKMREVVAHGVSSQVAPEGRDEFGPSGKDADIGYVTFVSAATVSERDERHLGRRAVLAVGFDDCRSYLLLRFCAVWNEAVWNENGYVGYIFADPDTDGNVGFPGKKREQPDDRLRFRPTAGKAG